MAKFAVDIKGATYEVDAPDEKTAWNWANATHAKENPPLKQVDINGPQGATGSFLENLGAGAGKALYDTARGLGQIGRMALPEKAANAMGLPTQTDIDEASRLDKPLMETGGGLIGNIGTNIGIALAPGAAMSRGSGAVKQIGQMMNTARPTLGGAAVGAGMGAGMAGIQPVASNESRATNMAVGGAFGAAPSLIGAGYRAAKSAVEPFYESGQNQILARALRTAAGGQGDDAMRALSEAGTPFVGPAQPGSRDVGRTLVGEFVPGSIPTAGQSSGNAGIAALERAAVATDPAVTQQYAQRMAQQNAARVGQVQELAGSDGAKSAAESAREAMANQLYKRAYARGVDISRMPEGMSPFVNAKTGVADIPAAAKSIGAKEPDSLLTTIRKMGGIQSADGTMRDITGEVRIGKGVKGIAPGLFHKGGVGLDDIASQLRDKGYAIADDVDGGVQQLKDMIREEIDGAARHYSVFDEGEIFAKMAAQKQEQESAQALFKKGVPRTRAGDKLVAIIDRPALKEAMDEAKIKAANEGIKLDTPEGSIRGLDYMKRAIDDKISKAVGDDKRVLTALKNEFVGLIDELSPSYQKARQTFQQMSSPVNQMEIAEAVAQKSINPLTGQMQPQAYARALSDQTAKTATGFRGATLENVMEPQQMGRLGAVQDDLARSVEAQNAGRGAGSDTVQKLAYANILNQSGMPSFLRNFAPAQIAGNLLGRGADAAYGRANRELSQRLAETLLDPQATAELLQNVTPSQRQQIMAQILSQTATPIAIGGASTLLNFNQ